MNHQKKIISQGLLLALFLMGCSSQKKAGNYFSEKSPYSFVVNEDGTFSYRYKLGPAYQHAEGAWIEGAKNKIKLNSSIKSTSIPLEIQERDNDTFARKRLNLFVVDVDMPAKERPYYRCGIFVNDSLLHTQSCDSLNLFEIDRPVTSYFFSLSSDERKPGRFLDTLFSKKEYTKMSTGNLLEVKFVYNDSFFSYRVFNNETLRISRKGLRFFVAKDDKWYFLPRK